MTQSLNTIDGGILSRFRIGWVSPVLTVTRRLPQKASASSLSLLDKGYSPLAFIG